MSNSIATTLPLDPAQPERLNVNSVYRHVTVSPAMCGPHTMFVAKAGDWTWGAVSALCEVDVFKARDANGAPVYLSYYYFHITAGPSLHSGNLEFGDRLDVVSSAFNFGGESILTLHRISRASSTSALPEHVTPEELYEHPSSDAIYIETFNRWISRSRPGSNADLVSSSPTGFMFLHLPSFPERYSPRRACTTARKRRGFLDANCDPPPAERQSFRLARRVDVSRDLNGAGLLHFASYFAYIDRAALEVWRRLGRSETSFLERVILDEKVCYLANADADAEITIEIEHWSCPGGGDMIHVVLEDARRSVTIAIGAVKVLHVD